MTGTCEEEGAGQPAGADVSEGAPGDSFCERWKNYKWESTSATETNRPAVV